MDLPPYYLPCDPTTSLWQGEILRGVVRHVVQAPATQSDAEALPIRPTSHPRIIVLHPDCDLAQDYRARQEAKPDDDPYVETEKMICEVLCCDLYEQAEIRPRIGGAAAWAEVAKNHNRRYHALDEARIYGDEVPIPQLVLDFRRSFAIHPRSIYDGIKTGVITRVARLGAPFVQDLAHRFYGFMSRVSLPD